MIILNIEDKLIVGDYTLEEIKKLRFIKWQIIDRRYTVIDIPSPEYAQDIIKVRLYKVYTNDDRVMYSTKEDRIRTCCYDDDIYTSRVVSLFNDKKAAKEHFNKYAFGCFKRWKDVKEFIL